MKMRIVLAGLVLGAFAGAAWAKLPPAPPVDPAKAAEVKKLADDTAKKDADLLGKYQDKAAANYRKNKGIKGPAPIAGKK